MTGKPELKKILYVDDDPDILKIARLSLERKGNFKVLACDSGIQALHEAAGFEPDLIIMDVVMPDMDGAKTLRELRKNPETSKIPVIFMTSRLHPDELDFYERLGVSGVLEKPFHPLTLVDQVRDLWNKL